MGKMGSGDVKRCGHTTTSRRFPDIVGESSLVSQIRELDVRLTLLCLRFFLLRPPINEVLPFTLLVLHG